MRLVLPLPPQVGNARGHWAVQHRRKKRFYKDCDARQNVGLIPPPPERPYTRASIDAHFFLWNLMDVPDNLPARLKAPLDWLRKRGYIVDDGPNVIGSPTLTQCIDRKNQRLEIELRGDA